MVIIVTRQLSPCWCVVSGPYQPSLYIAPSMETRLKLRPVTWYGAVDMDMDMIGIGYF